MKTIFTCFAILGFINSGFSQNFNIEKKGIIEAESRAYTKKMLLNENVNPNTLNYDLRYARLEIEVDPAVQYVSGTVTHHFKMLSNSSTIYFDLANSLNVNEVNYRGQSLSFQKLSSNEVKINFPASINANVLDSLSIKYSGAPASADAYVSTTQNGVPILATLSEPFGAREWWPTKQSMNDKIEKMDIKVTTSIQYNVAANGRLISETNIGNNKKTTFWRLSYPVPAYLVAIGVTNYTKLNDTMGSAGNTFPYVNYLYPTTAANPNVISNINWTKDCMATFENYFGDYPFRNDKYGHMQFNWGGGMEHTTMSSMGGFGQGLIAHELAHQWFGDKVTCGAWNDIWLNEGFATFGEHLIYEKMLMTPAAFQNYLSSEISSITAQASGSVYVPDGQLTSNRIFDGRLTYSKGAYTVRMLKWIMGETDFYAMLKAYHNAPQFANSYAKTTDFNAFVNQYTGKNLDYFFNQWIYGQGFPTYTIRWKQGTNNNVTFKVSQTQSHNSVAYYKMPLPVRVTGSGGQVADLVLDNSVNDEYFTKAVNFPISSVIFNYEKQILTPAGSVIKDNALSVSDIKKNDVQLYPNPAKNELTISGVNAITPFEIYSNDGKLVKKGDYQPNSKLNISTFSIGTYILKLGNQNLKFIKD